MQAIFENRKLSIEFLSKDEEEVENRRYKFKVDIKDFDTPDVNIEYDGTENVIIRTWIDEDGEVNIPKSHVAYKMFSLIEYEVLEIIQFLVKHM